MDGQENYEFIEGIAIIGMAGRFPGADNVNDFWQNLQAGIESISLFTDEDLIKSGISPSLIVDTNYVKASGILENIDLFDAAFFDINPKDAETTDPQHRLFLECAWEALENAGYDSTKSESRIGVYAGASLNNYLSIDLQDDQLGSAQVYQKLIGNDKDFLSTRVSYKLNLKGPSITVQTACSTSLVATTLAYQSLQSYQCDIALAGGVSIRVPQKTGYLYQQGGTLSPDGHCRAFDAKAQGTTIGNGVAIVVLKRLKDAIADRDHIYAVIKGAAINNDGAVKVGFTAPSVDGQAEAIAEAIMLAEVEPETISYVEAHGTGTALGDPIEIAALTKVFRATTEKKNFCAIGSVKTNIGHLDAAAGVAGLIKTALALKHQLIPPSLNFEQPNPEIDFANSPFFVNTKLTQWQAGSTPRRAGVSSLGMGGTNAHVVLEEAPILPASSTSRSWQLLLLSAKSESALQTARQNLAQHLMLHPDQNLADVAYTLQVGRRDFNYRQMLVCCDIQDAINELNEQASKRVFTQFQESNENRSIAFMFPGQGSQYADMGKELYETEPIFHKQVERCCQILTPHLGLDLRSLIYPSESEKAAAAEKLKQTCFTQSALFVIEYALSQLWISWGISPQAMIGHSIGEYVAACLAGVMSVEDALALVAIRGRLMQQLPSGKMLSVPLKEAEIQPLLDGNLSIAACNTPNSCVVSGTDEAINALQEQLANQGVECRLLHTSHAFHSQMMEPILEPFIAAVKKVQLHPPQIPFISNLTGTWIKPEEATDAIYWVRHLRQTVRFTAGISTLLEQPNLILLEVGPGRTLSTFAKQHIQSKQQIILSSLRHPKEEQADLAFLLNTLGRLWLAGVTINWDKFYTFEQRDRLPLPTYPFERERYWLEPQKTSKNSLATSRKKLDIADWFYIPVWKQSIAPQAVQTRKKVLIFIDAGNVGQEIAKHLESSGCDVISVALGEEFSQKNHCEYTINTHSWEDYDTLIANLRSLDQIPDVILHLWSITPNEQAQSGIELFENCQNLGFYSLLFLAKSLDKNGITQPIEILVVTNNLYDVVGTEILNPEKATVVGMCKAIPQQYPNITCRNVDIITSASDALVEKQLIEQLLTELNTKFTDITVAYRGRHRWVQTFEPFHWEAATSPLREEGVYLITGGLGGVGLEIAEYLAKKVRAKLVLTTHSTFPAAETWDEWLATHDEEDKYSRKILKVRSLQQLGAEVLILNADVADEAQMQAVIDKTLQHFLQINGVIYAAGIKLFKSIPEIIRSECEQQLKANGHGLFVLEKVLQGIELDFCVLISSLSSVVGALGMAAYPAAHSFTDAFIYKHNQKKSIPWVSVNYDNWLTSDLAVELANKPEISTDLFMANQQGLEVFEQILSIKKINQIIVSTTDLQAKIAQWIKPKEVSEKTDFKSLHSRPNLNNDYIAPRSEIEQKIADIWQEILGIQQIGIYDNFLEIGGDSLFSVQITARANKEGLRFTNQHLFEYPTIAQLAEIVSSTKTVVAEQGLMQGELALIPIQKWFFEQNLLDFQHWNQAILLEVQQPIEPVLLEQVIQQLLIHHDALRLRFELSESDYKQINAGLETVVPFVQVDLSTLSPDLQETRFTETVNKLQASLNLSDGPIVKVAYFDMGEHQPNRLLFIIHHLAVDIGSWRILLDDLQTAYQQLSQGQAIKLPAKTTSFKQWSQRLIEYAQSIELQQEQVYWLAASRESVLPLPKDNPDGANVVGSSKTISVILSVEETKALQEQVTASNRFSMDSVLLTALTQAVTKGTGNSALLVDLEGNSREVIFDDIDLSRTVGWFTNIAPILLEIGDVYEPIEVLKLVKEQLHNFPNQGLGYGVLKYLNNDMLIKERLRSLPPAEIIFLYLGNFEQTLPQSSLFKLSQQSSGLTRSLRGQRSHLLEINALVIQDQLKIDWIYSQNVHRQETIEQLANDFVAAVQSIIRDYELCLVEKFTPSDFAEFKSSQWDQDDIDNILSSVNY